MAVESGGEQNEALRTLSFAQMLAELRKFGVGMVLGHQHLGQLNREVLDGVLGNAGTLISFRLSAGDAAVIAAELGQRYKPADLVTLTNFELAVRLLINGAVSKLFSAKVLLPQVGNVDCHPRRAGPTSLPMAVGPRTKPKSCCRTPY